MRRKKNKRKDKKQVCSLLCVFRMLEIVDTAGQEEYKTLRDIYFKESDGFVLVYSITSPQSFQHAQKLKDRLTQMHGPGRPIILAGNKLDLEADRQVQEEEAYQYAVSQQIGFFECSAKEMVNVAELFSGVVRLVDRQRKIEAPAQTNNHHSTNNNDKPENGTGGGHSGSRKLQRMCVLL